MKKSEFDGDTAPAADTVPVTPASSGGQITAARRRNGIAKAHRSPTAGRTDGFETEMDESPPLLKAIGTEIAAAHAKTKDAFVAVLQNAAKCGLLLLAAKDLVKPGEFEAWFGQSKFGFTKVTRCKYMRLAERLCEEAESKPSLLLAIQPGTDGLASSFTFDELRLQTIVTSVSDGRSLSELYLDWDIVKKSQDKHLGNPVRGLGAGEGDSPEEIRRHWTKVVKGIPVIFARLQPEAQTALLTDLEGLLAKLKSIQQAPVHENYE